MSTQTRRMCPFCPIFESPEVTPMPIGNDMFGEAESIGGIASCGYCAQIVNLMDDEDKAWYVEQAKQNSPGLTSQG